MKKFAKGILILLQLVLGLGGLTWFIVDNDNPYSVLGFFTFLMLIVAPCIDALNDFWKKHLDIKD